MKYLGEDRVVGGTDCIWYGSSQAQIQAFRTLEISEEFQKRYGYPALTPQIKAKVFGLNATPVYGIVPKSVRNRIRENFQMQWLKAAIEEVGVPRPKVYGPTRRRDMLAALIAQGGLPS